MDLEEAKLQGIKEERERTARALALLDNPQIAERAGIVHAIRNGIAQGTPYAVIANRADGMLAAALESPGDLGTGNVDSPTGEKPGVRGAAGQSAGFVDG